MYICIYVCEGRLVYKGQAGESPLSAVLTRGVQACARWRNLPPATSHNPPVLSLPFPQPSALEARRSASSAASPHSGAPFRQAQVCTPRASASASSRTAPTSSMPRSKRPRLVVVAVSVASARDTRPSSKRKGSSYAPSRLASSRVCLFTPTRPFLDDATGRVKRAVSVRFAYRSLFRFRRFACNRLSLYLSLSLGLVNTRGGSYI